jgi:hypothetical protein
MTPTQWRKKFFADNPELVYVCEDIERHELEILLEEEYRRLYHDSDPLPTSG